MKQMWRDIMKNELVFRIVVLQQGPEFLKTLHCNRLIFVLIRKVKNNLTK